MPVDMNKLVSLDRLKEMKTAENAMMAATYSASKTYAVGDYVYYNGTLYKCTTAITTAEAWTSGHWTAAKLADDTSALKTATIQNKNDFDSVTYKEPDPVQLYDNAHPNIINAYSNGASIIGSSAHRVLWIPCKPLTEYTISASSSLWYNQSFGETIVEPAAGVTVVNNIGTGITPVTENSRVYCTVKTDYQAKYLVIGYYNRNVHPEIDEADVRASMMISEGTARKAYQAYTLETYLDAEKLPDYIQEAGTKFSKVIKETAESMTTGDTIDFTVPNIKKNVVLSFSANITTFGTLSLGIDRSSLNTTAYAVIDDTNLKIYRYTTEPVEWISLEHGLTIADYISVVVEYSNTEIGWANISISSNGETYKRERVAWMGCGNTAWVDATSGTYTNCVLTYGCNDFNCDTWLFGDSYFDYWCQYALDDGYNDFLCDGYSGRGAQYAVPSLEDDIKHGKPTNIVWCLGMNNADGDTVSNAWLEAFYSVIDICTAKSITPIFCTIPNTPTVKNTLKNAFIRESGYQYIDLAKYVGADSANSTWYTGLLSSDNVHPTETGAKMIAKFFESALPQMFSELKTVKP